jgi:hypothetical protein
MLRIGPFFSTVFGVKPEVCLKYGSARIGMETQWKRNGMVISGRCSIGEPDAAHRPVFLYGFRGKNRGSPQVRNGTDRHGNAMETERNGDFRSLVHWRARCCASARFFRRFSGSNRRFASSTDRHGSAWKHNGNAMEMTHFSKPTPPKAWPHSLTIPFDAVSSASVSFLKHLVPTTAELSSTPFQQNLSPDPLFRKSLCHSAKEKSLKKHPRLQKRE